MNLSIRLLQPGDAEAYRALMLRAYAEDADAFTSTAEERAGAPIAYWEQRLGGAGAKAFALGAFVDGGLQGSVALEAETRTKTAHKALLIGMYCAPALRGLGAGRALLQALLAAARARPALLCLNLTLTEGNTPALRLYEGAGFRCWGREPDAIRTADGRLLAKLHMGLRLRA